MTITAYYPMFLVKDLDTAVRQYTEDLGFQCLHTLDLGIIRLRVLACNGCRVDLFASDHELFQTYYEGLK